MATSGAVFEPYVARLLSAELGREVTCHDDNSRDGMYDLQIHGADGVQPVEVKTVGDDAELEQFQALRKHGPIVIRGEGAWRVGLAATIKVRTAEESLGDKLRRAETQARIAAPDHPRRQAQMIFEATRADGVTSVSCLKTASCLRTAEPGFRLMQAGWEGLVEPSERHLLSVVADAVQKWHGALQRLCQVEAARRHLVIVTRFGTDMAVQALLENTAVVPVTAPDVPAGLTDLWVVGGVVGQGSLRWAVEAGWSRVSPEAVSSAWAVDDSSGCA